MLLALVGLAAVHGSVAQAADELLVNEDFSGGTLPQGWTPVLGDWQVVGGRLQATTGAPRARISFGPAAPQSFRIEATVRFVQVSDSGRWLNVGIDYHAAEDYGAVLVARSGTTASNGLELAQAPQGGSYVSSPTGPAATAIGTGADHKLKVDVNGTHMVASVDGVPAMVADNLKRTGGGFGLVINNSTVQFDDVKVTQTDPQATPPSVPQGLRLSETGDQATVTWSAPAQAGLNADGTAATIAGYEVSLAPASTPESAVSWLPATGTAHTFSVPDDQGEQIIRVRAVNGAGQSGPSASVTPTRGEPRVGGFPLKLSGGVWPSGHVQGIAVDSEHGFVYYSFTDMLIKTDLSGNVIGTITGFGGHLGDLDFNPSDGKVYGSLEYKSARAFYIAVIDVDKIDRVGIDAQSSPIFATVYLPEVVEDFTADMDGNGVFDGDTANTPDHRYGDSGIDGVAIGPKFGSSDGKDYLTVAYGIYLNTTRTDNDNQVLLQYDISDWAQYEKPLVESAPHRDGPPAFAGKYFVYTGNTDYGVQNLEYDPWLQRWFMGVYAGSKPQFPNYTLFAVDAAAQPQLKTLHGLGGEQGLELPLAGDGLLDAASGIRGWFQKADVGIQSLGDGLYYLSTNGTVGSQQIATLMLSYWTGAPQRAFAPVTADYRVAPTFTSSAPAPGTESQPYSHTFTARSFPHATFSVGGGELPPGLRLDADGTLAGTPTASGGYAFSVTASNGTDVATQDVVLQISPQNTVSADTTVDVTVPSMLSLTLAGPATFGAFVPGLAADATATTTATVTSSAGDATLTASDPGHLSNGAFTLPSPLVVELSTSHWDAPVANDPVLITFKQHIGATDALRGGTYAKTVAFTLSTTTP